MGILILFKLFHTEVNFNFSHLNTPNPKTENLRCTHFTPEVSNLDYHFILHHKNCNDIAPYKVFACTYARALHAHFFSADEVADKSRPGSCRNSFPGFRLSALSLRITEQVRFCFFTIRLHAGFYLTGIFSGSHFKIRGLG